MRTALALAVAVLCVAPAHAAVTLIKDGKPEAAIFVAARVLAPNVKGLIKTAEVESENQRQRLRESVKDLSHYLEKISSAKIEIVAGQPTAAEKRIPILIAEAAESAYGPVGRSFPYRQAFRVVVGARGVGLYGESDLAASYAIYELLDNLGCRWFMPSELGEVIPSQKTIALDNADRKLAPYTLQRGIWYADEAFKRRNRTGGLFLHNGHALEMYLSKEDRARMPEVKAIIGGKPHDHRLKWSSKQLAEFLANKIITEQGKNPQPSWSLSPDDGNDFCESKEDRALDAGDFDVTNGTMSLTDRLIVLCNRVAEKVAPKYPDLPFGMLAYAQYIRAPRREKLHPSIVPVIAPIAFNRYHPMADDSVPGNKAVRDLVTSWGKASKMTGVYYYAFNLAETSAPCPLLTKWSADLPILYQNGCKFWIPETLPNFEVMMHALWMGNRLAWDPTQKPAAIVAEINEKFYGAAGPQMAEYWKFVDEVWVRTPEYSGCGFGNLRRWTPERLAKARQLLDAARTACKTPTEKQRVQMIDDSLTQFELFVKLRRDLAEGSFDALAAGGDAWMKQAQALGAKYKDQYAFCQVGWTPLTVGGTYFKSFYKQTYDDATRIAKGFQVLTPKPLRSFRYHADADKKAESLGWTRPDFDDKAWKSTDVCLETWSSIGYHDWFKSMGYRAEVELPAAGGSKKTFLWIGATDGTAKVFVNGKHIPFIDAKGKSADEFNGYCQPASFDISTAIRPGKNQVTILCTRTFFNELGTGGLLAPVTVYRER